MSEFKKYSHDDHNKYDAKIEGHPLKGGGVGGLDYSDSSKLYYKTHPFTRFLRHKIEILYS